MRFERIVDMSNASYYHFQFSNLFYRILILPYRLVDEIQPVVSLLSLFETGVKHCCCLILDNPLFEFSDTTHVGCPISLCIVYVRKLTIGKNV